MASNATLQSRPEPRTRSASRVILFIFAVTVLALTFAALSEALNESASLTRSMPNNRLLSISLRRSSIENRGKICRREVWHVQRNDSSFSTPPRPCSSHNASISAASLGCRASERLRAVMNARPNSSRPSSKVPSKRRALVKAYSVNTRPKNP